MNYEKMDLLNTLFMNSNQSVRLDDYENITKNIFYDNNKTLTKINFLIQHYDNLLGENK